MEQDKDFDKKLNLSAEIRKKYNGRTPVLIKENSNVEIKKKKFLVPNDITIGQFIHFLRKYINKLKPEEGMFIFINNQIPANNSLISNPDYVDKDGFVYVDLRKENTFG